MYQGSYKWYQFTKTVRDNDIKRPVKCTEIVPGPPSGTAAYRFKSIQNELTFIRFYSHARQYSKRFACLKVCTLTTLQDRWYHPHFTDVEIKSQRYKETCPRSQSKEVTKPGLLNHPNTMSVIHLSIFSIWTHFSFCPVCLPCVTFSLKWKGRCGTVWWNIIRAEMGRRTVDGGALERCPALSIGKQAASLMHALCGHLTLTRVCVSRTHSLTRSI